MHPGLPVIWRSTRRISFEVSLRGLPLDEAAAARLTLAVLAVGLVRALV
jgi:hypothetical protein